jgi:hypothetical protein
MMAYTAHILSIFVAKLCEENLYSLLIDKDDTEWMLQKCDEKSIRPLDAYTELLSTKCHKSRWIFL